MLGQQLDGHLALETHIDGQVHSRHAPVSEPALEAIAPRDLDRAHLVASPAPTPPPGPTFAPPWPPPGVEGPSPLGATVPPLVVGVVPVGVVTGVVMGVVAVVGEVVVAGVVVVVVGVVVVVVFAVVVVEVPVSGSWHSVRACSLRFEIPCCSLSRSPALSWEGSAAKSRSVFAIAASVAAQLPFPARAATATVSKSLCSGPASAVGIRPLPELPHETSRAQPTPSRPAAARRRIARAPGGRPGEGWRVGEPGMVTDRTPGAPLASRAGVRPGSRLLRRRCRSRSDGRRRSARRGRAAARTLEDRRRAAARR